MNKFLKRIIVTIYNMYKNRILLKKINTIYSYQKSIKQLFAISENIIKNHIEIWNKLYSHINIKWLKVYISISEKTNSNYVPENIYYNEIEPRLNNKPYSKVFTDKNLYHQLYS